MYSKWSKTLISNVYNIEDLKKDILDETEEKNKLTKDNIIYDKDLKQYIAKLDKKNNLRDDLISKKVTDIDKEVQNVNPRLIEEKSTEDNKILKNLNLKLKAYGDKEIPEEIDLELLRVTNNEKNELHIQTVKNKDY